jgi:hypothetical protein
MTILDGKSDTAFLNRKMEKTRKIPTERDERQEENFWWASPVRVYLELMAGDKRDQETAEQVKSYILNNF